MRARSPGRCSLTELQIILVGFGRRLRPTSRPPSASSSSGRGALRARAAHPLPHLRRPVEKLIVSVGVTGGTHPPGRIAPSADLAGGDRRLRLRGVSRGRSRRSRPRPGRRRRARYDLDRYRRVIELIGERCDMVVNLTTDLRDRKGFARSSSKPELASFPGGTIQLGERVLWAPMPVLRELAAASTLRPRGRSSRSSTRA